MTRQESQPDQQPPAGRGMTLGEQVKEARSRAFVGRDHELALLGSALSRTADSPSVYYVQGPGGIGKSTLLREFADRARRDGRRIVFVDGRVVGPSTSVFEAAAGDVAVGSGTVLIIDTFEQCQPLETWLREAFLPRLPGEAIVVIGGRRALDIEWSADPGWSRALRTVELQPFTSEQSSMLLAANGIERSRHPPVVGFAGGNPLALVLAAAVVTARPGTEATWHPSGQILAALLNRLVGDVPSAAHRRALEAAAQAFTMTEDLLRAALPGEDASQLFGWLRDLPFMNVLQGGVHPHDAVRETLVADLRWRDLEAFQQMQARLGRTLLARLREAPASRVRAAMGELFFLYREVPTRVGMWDAGDQDLVQDEPLRAEDVPAVLAFAAESEGKASAELVRYWLDRQPGAFTLYRHLGTGRPVAFSARLSLPAPADPRDIAADPVVAAAWQYCDATAPVRPGEHMAMTRFAIYPGCYQLPSPVMQLMHQLSLGAVARSGNLAHGVLVYQDVHAWQRWVGHTMPDTGYRAEVGGRTYGLFANDWRQRPFERWLDQLVDSREPDIPAPAGKPPFQPLPRASFDEAVRHVLQLWNQRGALGNSPLARTALVPEGSPDPEAGLRERVEQALDATSGIPRAVRGHDAVVATYLTGAPTQQAAARRLGLPFSTYRRHLKGGLQDLSDRLWKVYCDYSMASRRRPDEHD
ncbi:MAG TPA: ATP-binding protein [Streptosporangiaceae bacterium]